MASPFLDDKPSSKGIKLFNWYFYMTFLIFLKLSGTGSKVYILLLGKTKRYRTLLKPSQAPISKNINSFFVLNYLVINLSCNSNLLFCFMINLFSFLMLVVVAFLAEEN